MKNFLFWTVAALLCLPAAIGLLVGAVIVLAGLILLVFALVAGFVLCIPIIWWCALSEGMQFRAVMSRLPKSAAGN